MQSTHLRKKDQHSSGEVLTLLFEKLKSQEGRNPVQGRPYLNFRPKGVKERKILVSLTLVKWTHVVNLMDRGRVVQLSGLERQLSP